MSQWKEKIGHTTIDLGVAPEKLECCQDGETKAIDPMDKLKSVRGFLILFSLEIMSQEDLRPMFIESELYASHKCSIKFYSAGLQPHVQQKWMDWLGVYCRKRKEKRRTKQ